MTHFLDKFYKTFVTFDSLQDLVYDGFNSDDFHFYFEEKSQIAFKDLFERNPQESFAILYWKDGSGEVMYFNSTVELLQSTVELGHITKDDYMIFPLSSIKSFEYLGF